MFTTNLSRKLRKFYRLPICLISFLLLLHENYKYLKKSQKKIDKNELVIGNLFSATILLHYKQFRYQNSKNKQFKCIFNILLSKVSYNINSIFTTTRNFLLKKTTEAADLKNIFVSYDLNLQKNPIQPQSRYQHTF